MNHNYNLLFPINTSLFINKIKNINEFNINLY